MPYNHPSVKCERISNILDFNYKRVRLLNNNKDLNKNEGDMTININDLKKIIYEFK